MILIICTSDDVHLKPVVSKMETQSYFVIYTDLLLSRYKFQVDEKGSVIVTDNKTKQSCEILRVRKVWHRRTSLPNLKSKEKDSVTSNVMIREGAAFLKFIKGLLINHPWISGHPINEFQILSKISQIHTAGQVGFNVPKTVFSNDKNFLLECFKGIDLLAVKPIAANFMGKGKNTDRDVIFFTTCIFYKDLLSIPASRIKKTVNFLQEYIDKAYELRVTVVDTQIFTCKISSSHLPTGKGKIDFRQGYDEGLIYEAINMPDTFKHQCLEFIRRYQLVFGCFDFVVDKEGQIFFLECNSNGQWLWIEEAVPQLDISKAIAEYLVR